MPNFDSPLLLLIPLLSGYLFLISFYFTRYYHSKIETQRLIFNSIICAFIVYYVSYFADLKLLQKYPEFREDLKTYNPFKYYASSKTCECGVKNKDLKLSDREWVCSSCGVINQRDLLASKNILKEGRRSLGDL